MVELWLTTLDLILKEINGVVGGNAGTNKMMFM